MRNYRFAILAYDPRQEFELRHLIRKLGDELQAQDWSVHSISSGLQIHRDAFSAQRGEEAMVRREREGGDHRRKGLRIFA